MAGDPDTGADYADDAGSPDEEAQEEHFLNEGESEDEDEVAIASPEVELLNDVTQHYLNEIGAKPLFTPEQEFEWACRARSGEFIARQKPLDHVCVTREVLGNTVPEVGAEFRPRIDRLFDIFFRSVAMPNRHADSPRG